MSHHVVAIGESMIRLSAPAGTRLDNAPQLEVHIGGAEGNVAVAVSRMGRRAAWITSLPDNVLGRRAAADVARHGVDVCGIDWVQDRRMGLYFVDSGSPPRATSVLYDRADSAAAHMATPVVDWSLVEAASIVHLTGITAALSESCHQVVAEAIERARAAGTLVSFDVNYRAKLWSLSTARAVLGPLVAEADLLLATAEDATDVFGVSADAESAAGELAGLTGAHRVVVTAGSRGAAWTEGAKSGFTDAFAAVEIDRIGGGDAFAAGVLLGLLDGDLPAGVTRGLAMAALKLGMRGDHLIVDPAEVDAVIAGGGRSVSR